jgi:hypothetical protein
VEDCFPSDGVYSLLDMFEPARTVEGLCSTSCTTVRGYQDIYIRGGRFEKQLESWDIQKAPRINTVA